MARPFFPTVPSREQMAFVNTLCDGGTEIFYVNRKPCIIPFLDSKQVEIRFVLPVDVSFESWYTNTFRKIGAKDIEEAHESITAVARTCEGATVRIRAVSRKQVVHCHLAFQ